MFEAGVLNGLTRISVEIGSSKSRSDDDFIDRVNHSYSTTILMLCTLIVLSRQFIGKPMSCWTPNEFTGAQEEYATMLCWVTSTYFISPKEPAIPPDLSVRRKDSVHYYQWVPFLLMFQAALFSVPCIVWRLLNWQSRLHLWTIMELANKLGDITEPIQNRTDSLYYVVRHLEDALVMRHRRRLHRKRHSSTSAYQLSVNSPPVGETVSLTGRETDTPWNTSIPISISHRSRVPGPRPCSPRSGSYLAGLYLIVKGLYVINSTGQLFLVSRFLGQPTVFYGFYMLLDLVHGDMWYETGKFPRVTFCDFDMRRMGSNYHRHTLQCVLGINMFNEKIFIFLWFWLMVISLMNINSFLRWCFRSTFQVSRVSFIRSLLLHRIVLGTSSQVTSTSSSSTSKLQSHSDDVSSGKPYSTVHLPMTESERKASASFTENVLGQDGVFVLRLISINAGRQVASQILERLWSRFNQAADSHPVGRSATSKERRPQLNKLYIPPIAARLGRPVGLLGKVNESTKLPVEGHTITSPVSSTSDRTRQRTETLDWLRKVRKRPSPRSSHSPHESSDSEIRILTHEINVV
ncbi:Innexin unc-7 [Clonorchis sinensis]|uniref:Innexin n=1 Tax=Clonorchis sinensis TaxID=79923 RepID=A0A3R7H257_CLOSI|nr:Innexin unc-7 [Clonorchis sinensis]